MCADEDLIWKEALPQPPRSLFKKKKEGEHERKVAETSFLMMRRFIFQQDTDPENSHAKQKWLPKSQFLGINFEWF